MATAANSSSDPVTITPQPAPAAPQPTAVAAAATAAAAPKAVAPAAAPAPKAAQQQRAVQPQAASVQQARVSPIDAVIDDVLGGDLGMQERQLAADEVAYAYFSKVREAAGDQLDPAVSAQLNELVAITQAEKDAILQKSNRVARRVLRPLGYKMLEVQGLNPAAVSPAAARAALEAELNSEQQAAVDAEAERLFEEVYLPELEAASRAAGVQDPDEVWEQFGQNVLAQRPEEPQQQSAAAIAVPAALAGAVVALVVSKFFGWLQRRRQRRYEQTETGSEYYEEEVLTASDEDAASAYDE